MKEIKSNKRLAGKRAEAENSESDEIESKPKSDKNNEGSKDSSDGSDDQIEDKEDESKSSKEEVKEESLEEEKEPVKKEKAAPVKKEAKEQGDNPAELYVTSLPFETDEDEIKEYFSEYGEIASIKMLQRNGKYSGRSFVVFKNVEDADKALEANGKEFKGRSLVVTKATNPPQLKESTPVISPTRVFVANIAFNSTEEKIKEFFADCGDIKEVKMINKPEGGFRGVAFVEFESEESAKEAIKLSGKELGGREIKVSPAEAKKSKSSNRDRGGSRGRGGFRGGRGERGGRGGRGGRGDRGRRGFRGNRRGRFG